jgi:hypothetical protein
MTNDKEALSKKIFTLVKSAKQTLLRPKMVLFQSQKTLKK